MDLHLLPGLCSTQPACIHWDAVSQHLNHIAENWQKQVQYLTEMNQAGSELMTRHRTLRSEHRHILQTHGHAAAERNRRKYAEYDSALFDNIHDDTAYLGDSQKEPRLICSGFAHFSTRVRRVAGLCEERRAPMLIATKLRHLQVFSERFSPSDPSIASRTLWAGHKGTVSEWFYRPHRQALCETASHFSCIMEHLHLAVVLSQVLGNQFRSYTHQYQHAKGKHAGLKVEAERCEAKVSVAMQPSIGGDANTGSVVEEIEHSEPAAVIDQEVAALQVQAEADDQFALIVTRRLEISEVHELDHERFEVQGSQSEKVFLLSFRSGKGELFRKMLLQDKEFKPLRMSLEAVGCPSTLRPHGTVILVKPSQYFHVMSALGHRSLKRYQLLIAESMEYLVDEVLARMSKKSRPYARQSEREDIAAHACTFVYKRSFICEASNRFTSRSVAQSTTEALRSASSSSQGYFVHTRGINPRRCALGFW